MQRVDEMESSCHRRPREQEHSSPTRLARDPGSYGDTIPVKPISRETSRVTVTQSEEDLLGFVANPLPVNPAASLSAPACSRKHPVIGRKGPVLSGPLAKPWPTKSSRCFGGATWCRYGWDLLACVRQRKGQHRLGLAVRQRGLVLVRTGAQRGLQASTSTCSSSHSGVDG